MLELYHAGMSTCSQKVRLVLSEKGLDYESHEIDLISGEQHNEDYVKLNPNHVVPTLVHDGNAFIESTAINEYIEDAFPDKPARPSDAASLHAMRLWTKYCDEKVHPMAGVITFGIGARPVVMAQPEEVREANLAKIPDPKYRALRKSVIEHGIDAPEFEDALRIFSGMLAKMESALDGNDWLAGDNWSLADACLVPYVMRMDSLAMDPMFGPNVKAWYARMQARDSFADAVTRFVPDFVIDMFKEAGGAVWGDLERKLEAAGL